MLQGRPRRTLTDQAGRRRVCPYAEVDFGEAEAVAEAGDRTPNS